MWNIQRMSFYVENLHLYNNFFVRVQCSVPADCYHCFMVVFRAMNWTGVVERSNISKYHGTIPF